MIIKKMIILFSVLIVGSLLCKEDPKLDYAIKSMRSWISYDYTEGLDFAKKSVDVDSTWSMSYYVSSLNNLGLMEYEEAIEDLQKAIEFSINDPILSKYFLVLYHTAIKMNNTEMVNKCVEYFDKAIKYKVKNDKADLSSEIKYLLAASDYSRAQNLIEFCLKHDNNVRKIDELKTLELILNYFQKNFNFIGKYVEYMNMNKHIIDKKSVNPYLCLYYFELGDFIECKEVLDQIDFDFFKERQSNMSSQFIFTLFDNEFNKLINIRVKLLD